MNLIYHITARESWAQAQAGGAYRGDTLDSQGFIHCSIAQQIERVANRFYRGQQGLVLLCIDSDKAQPEIRYEAAEDAELFPHIYGPLDVDAVVRIVDFSPKPDGMFELPREIAPN
jgi:uncharacterized protein (DUF952 family)